MVDARRCTTGRRANTLGDRATAPSPAPRWAVTRDHDSAMHTVSRKKSALGDICGTSQYTERLLANHRTSRKSVVVRAPLQAPQLP